MKLRRSFIVLAALGAGATAVACADLFHDTDAPTLCDMDAAAPGCSAVKDGAVPTDICAPDHATALTRAKHACAWLAACETPIGKNVTGECMAEAILAYDCAANPNRKPKLDAKTFWTGMAKVKTCADVDDVVFPQKGISNCDGTGFIGCTKWTSSINLNTRIACPTKGERYTGENCVLQGKTCDSAPLTDAGLGNNGGLCVGNKGKACTKSGCDGAHLVQCDDAGIDRGLDCSQFGTGTCVPSGAQPACRPDGPAVAASADIKCTPGGEAIASASGFEERVDCTYLSGPAPGNCTPIPNATPGTPAAAACKRSNGGCSTDSCAADKLVACIGGNTVRVDCVGDGLKPCNDSINTLEGTRAACGKP